MSDKWWQRGAAKHKVERDPSIPDTVRDYELDKGGWRYDERNTGYKLTWEQLLEYERKSMEVEDDIEFDEWFTQFRKEKGISSRSYAGSLSSWSSEGWEETSDKKKGKWLSSWWASDVYRGFSGGSEDSTRLALVLQAVKAVVRVVDNTTPPLSVDWAQQDMSYTDFSGHSIRINAAPVRDKRMEDGQAIDITTGFGLHEASHSEHSRDPYQLVSKPKPLRPMQIAGMLLNYVEDIRIEKLTAEEFPGFAGYFEKSLEWVRGQSEKHFPKKWGPSVFEKLGAVFGIIRFDDGPKYFTDASFAAEIPWWLNWRDEYLAGKVDARTTIQRGLDRLGEDPETKKEMDELAKAEKEMEEALGSLREAFKQAMDGAAKKLGKLVPCINDVGKEVLTAKEAEEVRKMVNENLIKDVPHMPTANGQGNWPLFILHPLEDERSKRAYIGKPKAMLQRLKAALVFRQELPRYTTRLLRSGTVDEEELWRWKDRDYRVFSEEVIATRPQTQMTLLVDMSGSMHGQKLDIAQELAQLFIWALKDMDGVETKVFGHTGDSHATGGAAGSVDIYKLWERGEPLTRLGLIKTLPHINNYDGHAIAWCAKEILGRGQPDEQRVIIVLSDGYPAGRNYGGHTGQRHVKEVTGWAERNGVGVIQIAIDHSLDATRQAAMFKMYFPFVDFDQVPKDLTRLLSKLT